MAPKWLASPSVSLRDRNELQVFNLINYFNPVLQGSALENHLETWYFQGKPIQSY